MKLRNIALLLGLGIVVGVAMPGRLTALFGNVTLYVFLPALIFEAAWSLDFRLMNQKRESIALLAVPGVAVTAALVAAAAHFAGGLGWPAALVLGAVLSATDPVAVVAIFRRLRVPRPLATIVESESLLNDALAVVLYRAILAGAVLSTGLGAMQHAAARAAAGIAIAIVIGFLFAALASFALRKSVGALFQIAATFAGAYGSYALCDRFGWSGIFAVIVFAVTLREVERRRVSVARAVGVETFWSAAAVAANVVLFFLTGAAIDFSRVPHLLGLAAVTIAAVIAARSVLAYGLLWFARGQLQPFWMTVVRMAGIRGALSLALALSIPASLAERTLVIDATFAVVVVTILVGTLTLAPRMERMNLEAEGP